MVGAWSSAEPGRTHQRELSGRTSRGVHGTDELAVAYRYASSPQSKRVVQSGLSTSHPPGSVAEAGSRLSLPWVAMKRDKELPLLPEDEPMTEEDLGSWRKVSFDEIDLIAPSIRKVIEHHMPNLVERLPPEGDLVVQVQRRIEAKTKRQGIAKARLTRTARPKR